MAVTADSLGDYCPGVTWHPRRSLQEEGTCGGCGKPLTGRSWWFCSSVQGRNPCRERYFTNHDWSEARREAVRRSGRVCAHCGATVPEPEIRRDSLELERDLLEVNHKVPRNGQGYRMGCWNHQDNLEVLCHPCHAKVTAGQARDRAEVSRLARAR